MVKRRRPQRSVANYYADRSVTVAITEHCFPEASLPNRAKHSFSFALLILLISPASPQTLTTLHSFSNADGANPEFVVLAEGADGNLYGTTSLGGLSTKQP